TFSEQNPKVKVNYKPNLIDGIHNIKVYPTDASGNTDSIGYSKSFQVSSELQVLYLYNYPNPFSDETYFTFKLTQIPDEFILKIFTIAGRLIKEIKVNSLNLNYDFNRIYWDGKDQDGDRIANGVYFYKVIVKQGDKTKDYTQKLAIVR
ncbi:MAG: T9SS type A sorting domain-containing protein, partial [Ignavibacteriales bacterium]|nr:T9SS type A sorting domain-containing protein [Ignavibacteriales bacterium]